MIMDSSCHLILTGVNYLGQFRYTLLIPTSLNAVTDIKQMFISDCTCLLKWWEIWTNLELDVAWKLKDWWLKNMCSDWVYTQYICVYTSISRYIPWLYTCLVYILALPLTSLVILGCGVSSFALVFFPEIQG